LRTGASPAPSITGITPGQTTVATNDSLNLLFFDPHLNVEVTLQDLAAKAILQILAEPNLLALNGHPASFVSGGEFPYPTLNGGGSGVGQITIQFRQFGVQIQFLPTITPRGTIRLHVTPEVSSLDYANALTVSGFTIPALNTRKVDTDVELADGQSFAIAGLLDQRTTDSWSRMPGLADIPLIGKLFEARSRSKSNSELLVIVTPEIVSPASEVASPEFPVKFLDGKGVPTQAPRTPGADKTGPPPIKPTRDELPVQELEKLQLMWQTPSFTPQLQPLGGAGSGGSAAGQAADAPAGPTPQNTTVTKANP
jgi:pilus assembly protein CpaC